MPDLTQLRGELAGLIRKTKDHVAGLRKDHPQGRTLASLAAAPPPPDAAPGESLGLRPLPEGLIGGADPRPPYAPGLDDFERQISGCLRCALGATRKNLVFGLGDARARLVFVGEAPGAEEDAKGEPFVGAAGALLTKIISAMGLTRQKVYICNLVKCRPPLNRDPGPGEAAACFPYLQHQLKLISPKVVVTLGNHATHALLGRENEGISRLRGGRFEWQGIAVYPTYHPSALLRNEGLKKDVWLDMKNVLKELGGPGA